MGALLGASVDYRAGKVLAGVHRTQTAVWLRGVRGLPALLELPIGCHGNWRDQADLLRCAQHKPCLVAKILRKRFV